MQSTTIKTFEAVINGRVVSVQTLLAPYSRDAISYKIGRKVLSFDRFWDLNPKVN